MNLNRQLLASAFAIGLFTLILASCTDNGTTRTDDQAEKIDTNNVRKHIISTKVADEYTSSYLEGLKELNDKTGGNYLDSNFNLAHSELFNRDAIAILLAQEGAAGIRMYFGRSSDGKIHLVLYPVDAAGKDIRKILVPNANTQDAQAFAGPPDDGQAIEVGQRQP